MSSVFKSLTSFSQGVRVLFENKQIFNYLSTFHHVNRDCQESPLRRPYTIVVEGNIGSGKTTFLEPFVKNHSDKVEVLSEPVNEWRDCQGHNLLDLMYHDPVRHSLTFQTYVQLTMVKLHNRAASKPIRMMERSLLSSRYCFVENLYNNNMMSDSEYAVLSEWFNFLITCPTLNFKIDQIIYLRTHPEIAYERIMKRQRSEELKISFKYIQDLHNLHEEWLVKRTKFQPLPAPVTVIDANEELSTLSNRYSQVENSILGGINASILQLYHRV